METESLLDRRKLVRSWGGRTVRLIDWRSTADPSLSIPSRVRWAPGSLDTLIVESRRRRYRLCLRLRWWRSEGPPALGGIPGKRDEDGAEYE